MHAVDLDQIIIMHSETPSICPSCYNVVVVAQRGQYYKYTVFKINMQTVVGRIRSFMHSCFRPTSGIGNIRTYSAILLMVCRVINKKRSHGRDESSRIWSNDKVRAAVRDRRPLQLCWDAHFHTRMCVCLSFQPSCWVVGRTGTSVKGHKVSVCLPARNPSERWNNVPCLLVWLGWTLLVEINCKLLVSKQ